MTENTVHDTVDDEEDDDDDVIMETISMISCMDIDDENRSSKREAVVAIDAVETHLLLVH
jgi:hypothetical protein